jgi:hypothetical protein
MKSRPLAPRFAGASPLVFAWAAALCLSGCFKEDRVAGGTTTETEAMIICALTRPDGAAAAGARVHIRPSGYLPDPPADSAAAYGDLIADSLGVIRWTAKAEGLFDLEGALGDSLGTLIRNISPGKEAKGLNGILERNGSLRARLASPEAGKTYTLRAFGLERYAEADSAGSFELGLPVGAYRLVITASAGSLTPLVVEGARIESGKETLLDSLRFPDLDSALIGYWPFEEPSGETIADASGIGPSGTLKGVARLAGKVGQALRFTNGQGYVDLGAGTPDAFVFPETQDFSFAAWAKIGNKIPNHGVARRIVSKQKNVSGYTFILRIFPDGNPGFTCRHPAAAKNSAGLKTAAPPTVRDLKAPVDVADGDWHHLAAVARQGRLYLYVDGVLRASAHGDSIVPVDTYTDYNDKSPVLYPDPGLDGHLVIGCVTSGQDGFDGLIDEVRIYGRALDPSEALQLARPFRLP